MPTNLSNYFKFSPFFIDSTSMSDLDWERLQTKIDKVPVLLYDLLVDSKTSDFIEGLLQKYIQLSVQGPDIARLIRDVVIADVFIGDMPQELSKRLGIDPTTAREVANLVVSQLFVPVLEDIKKVHNAKFPGRLPAKPAVPNTPPAVTTPQKPPPSFAKASEGTAEHYPGEDLPESGGNIIDLRNK